MKNSNSVALIAMSISWILTIPLTAQDDWANWRGPTDNGIAAVQQSPPTSWSDEKNVVWKTKVPGKGHATPIIVGDQIFLATSEQTTESQSVVCFDRGSGKQRWQTEVNSGGFNARLHPKNSHASQTIATDRKFVFAVFNHHDEVHVTALDFSGEIQWTRRVGGFKCRRGFGFGSSPIVFKDTVIVTNQNDGESAIVAFNVTDGEPVWRIDRHQATNFSTPVVAEVAGKTQMFISGTKNITSYDPTSGEKLWEAPAAWDVSCAVMIWDDDTVFASGGFPARQTLAVKADGSAKVVWSNRVKAYEQSMILVDGYVYTHAENGAVYCWRASDGKEMWAQRFSSGRAPAQSASPVLANGNLYFTDEFGQTLVIKASPDKLEEVTRNWLGKISFASMALCGNQIFTRVADENPRQEWLYCLGEK